MAAGSATRRSCAGALLRARRAADLVGGIGSVTLGDEEAARRGTQKTVRACARRPRATRQVLRGRLRRVGGSAFIACALPSRTQILERKAPPTFPIVVEIRDRALYVAHWVEVRVGPRAIFRHRAAPPPRNDGVGTPLRSACRPPVSAPARACLHAFRAATPRPQPPASVALARPAALFPQDSVDALLQGRQPMVQVRAACERRRRPAPSAATPRRPAQHALRAGVRASCPCFFLKGCTCCLAWRLLRLAQVRERDALGTITVRDVRYDLTLDAADEAAAAGSGGGRLGRGQFDDDYDAALRRSRVSRERRGERGNGGRSHLTRVKGTPRQPFGAAVSSSFVAAVGAWNSPGDRSANRWRGCGLVRNLRRRRRARAGTRTATACTRAWSCCAW